MKQYLRYLWIGVVCGILCIFGIWIHSDGCTLSQIILSKSFIYVEFEPSHITVVSREFIPLLLFQILYGSFIYRHFCSASVYFFSRKQDRTKWFLCESGKLYILTLEYLIVMLVTGSLLTALVVPVEFDESAILLAVYYLLIQSLFLFATTIGINICSIIFDNGIGFAIFAAIEMFGIAGYLMMGRILPEDGILTQQYVWLLKINPFAHLVFRVHSSKWPSISGMLNIEGITFDLNSSVLFFLIISLIFVALGVVCVNRHDFITNNKELE